MAEIEVKIVPEDVWGIFNSSHKTKGEVLVKIAQTLYGDRDPQKWEIRISDKLDAGVMARFKRFDETHHPEATPGEAWMQYGFTVDPALPEDVVRFTEVV